MKNPDKEVKKKVGLSGGEQEAVRLNKARLVQTSTCFSQPAPTKVQTCLSEFIGKRVSIVGQNPNPGGVPPPSIRGYQHPHLR